jgi:hypothetical protein
VKITPAPEAKKFFDRSRSRVEAEKGFNEEKREESRDSPEKKRSFKEESVEISDEDVEVAIQDFSEGQSASNLEIQAVAQGTGPGLKVVLKDGSGSVIRQMTGEEFMRLKENLQDSSTSSGKMLDQKF